MHDVFICIFPPGRCNLDKTTGSFTITNLILEDGGNYTPEINSVVGGTMELKVISEFIRFDSGLLGLMWIQLIGICWCFCQNQSQNPQCPWTAILRRPSVISPATPTSPLSLDPSHINGKQETQSCPTKRSWA